MAILKKILIGLVALVVLFLLVGFLLPRQFKVERELTINAPQIPIYQMVSAPTNWPKWAVWNQRDPNMKMTFSGTGAGAGAKWSWESKTEGNGAMEFTEADSPRRIGYRLSFPDMGMESKGELKLTAINDSITKISWSNEGDFGSNPVFRYFGLFMDKLVGPDFDAGLAALKILVEKQVADQAKAKADEAAAAAASSAAAPAASTEPAPAAAKADAPAKPAGK
jgi:uncharacterized protein YndB with AHSA1/START domain